MELKPCISPGSHYEGVSSEWCLGQLHSQRTDNPLWQPTRFSKTTHLLPNASPPVFFLSQLSFSAWLSHHMPDCQVAGAQKISQSFHQYLLFFFALILNYLSHLWAFLFVCWRNHSSYIYAHGSLMGKKVLTNSLIKPDRLGIKTHRVFNHCMDALFDPYNSKANTLAKNCNLNPLDYST